MVAPYLFKTMAQSGPRGAPIKAALSLGSLLQRE